MFSSNNRKSEDSAVYSVHKTKPSSQYLLPYRNLQFNRIATLLGDAVTTQ